MPRAVRWLVAILAGVTVWAYVSTAFIFNPLTFRRNAVLSMPWRWYRGPLQVEYGILTEDGWQFWRLGSLSEARHLYREVLSSDLADAVQSEQAGSLVWFGVRRPSDGAILLDVRSQEGSEYALLRGEIGLRLSSGAKALLAERLGQARKRASH